MPVVVAKCFTLTNKMKGCYFKTYVILKQHCVMVGHFEVKPDVQADFTNMPYPNETFRMVVFDPPHLLRNVGKLKFADIYGSLNPKARPTGYQHIKYGSLPNQNWRDLLKRGFAECFRVLKHGGFLIFKWNETDIKVTEVLKLTPEKPIFGHISGKRANTHWICFMKD